MRTFEEWMAYQYQQVDVTSLGPEELKDRRSRYDVASEAQRQVKIWTPAPGNGKDLLYAVAIRDASDLWLASWVRKSTKGEYFVRNRADAVDPA